MVVVPRWRPVRQRSSRSKSARTRFAWPGVGRLVAVSDGDNSRSRSRVEGRRHQTRDPTGGSWPGSGPDLDPVRPCEPRLAGRDSPGCGGIAIENRCIDMGIHARLGSRDGNQDCTRRAARHERSVMPLRGGTLAYTAAAAASPASGRGAPARLVRRGEETGMTRTYQDRDQGQALWRARS